MCGSCDACSGAPAVDAVICLAGDCSHGAYRLAKRYCKAKGKPCALLANSSIHALTRCIEALPAY